MKKIKGLVLVSALGLCLCACGGQNEEVVSVDKVPVTTETVTGETAMEESTKAAVMDCCKTTDETEPETMPECCETQEAETVMPDCCEETTAEAEEETEALSLPADLFDGSITSSAFGTIINAEEIPSGSEIGK